MGLKVESGKERSGRTDVPDRVGARIQTGRAALVSRATFVLAFLRDTWRHGRTFPRPVGHGGPTAVNPQAKRVAKGPTFAEMVRATEWQSYSIPPTAFHLQHSTYSIPT
jgi:hypothetical protein